jgi:hypothetical protein
VLSNVYPLIKNILKLELGSDTACACGWLPVLSNLLPTLSNLKFKPDTPLLCHLKTAPFTSSGNDACFVCWE